MFTAYFDAVEAKAAHASCTGVLHVAIEHLLASPSMDIVSVGASPANWSTATALSAS